MKLALVLFVITYVLLIAFGRWRPWIAAGSALVFILLGILPANRIFPSVDWNILMMLAGTMGTVALFIESKMPNRLADLILAKTPNIMWAAAALSLFAGIVSAFVDNVATVLMIAPVAIAIAKRLDTSPVSLIISIAVSSNLQGAATLVGDTTSILLGGYADMDFMDFIFLNGKPSIFWAVEIGAIVTIPVILFLFRKERAPIPPSEPTEVTDLFPTFMLVGSILLLIAASFLPEKPAVTNGIICLSIFAAGALRSFIKTKSLASVKDALRQIDYETLILLAGLFLVIAGITEAGVIDAVSQLFVNIGGGDLFRMYTLIVWGSVLFSAFIDNIPYVATMLPVVSGIASMQGWDPYVLYFGLLVGSTLGGNLTPIGASANIAGIGILRREGYNVSTGDFMRIGVPFTLIAVISGYLYCWLVWA